MLFAFYVHPRMVIASSDVYMISSDSVSDMPSLWDVVYQQMSLVLDPLVSVYLYPMKDSEMGFPLASIIITVRKSFGVELVPVVNSPILGLMAYPLDATFHNSYLVHASPALCALFSRSTFSNSPLEWMCASPWWLSPFSNSPIDLTNGDIVDSYSFDAGGLFPSASGL